MRVLLFFVGVSLCARCLGDTSADIRHQEAAVARVAVTRHWGRSLLVARVRSLLE
jgi:hypothetical protein